MLEINFILSISKPIQRLFLMEQLVICRSISWDAWTRQIACRTRVRRDKAWGTPLPVRRCHVQFFLFFIFIIFFSQLTLTRHKLGPMCTESGQFTPNQAALGHIDRQSKRTEMPKKGRNRAWIKPKSALGEKFLTLKILTDLKYNHFVFFLFLFFFFFLFFVCVWIKA